MSRVDGYGFTGGITKPFRFHRPLRNKHVNGRPFYITEPFMVKNNPIKGYTLIELLIVVAIIGILAAIAIPIYKGYIIRAKLTEVINAISYVVSALNNYHHEAVQNKSPNVWPDCGSIAQIQTSLGVALPEGRIGAASVDQGTGVISVMIANIDSSVNGSIITLTPSIDASNSTISWKWGGTIPLYYLPKD